MRIRRARPGDIDAMLAIKKALAMPVDPGATTSAGGFLLGASHEGYAMLLSAANVLLLEDARSNIIAGLAVTIPDALLRQSDIWARRGMIVPEGDGRGSDFWESIESSSIGYFDQLAVLPDARYRLFAPALAMAAFTDLVRSGHHDIFATIVREPVRNIAAVALLEGVGGTPVGSIDELYPEVGRIVSTVYHIDARRTEWMKSERAARIGRGVEKSRSHESKTPNRDDP
jgi:hypothetical protein